MTRTLAQQKGDALLALPPAELNPTPGLLVLTGTIAASYDLTGQRVAIVSATAATLSDITFIVDGDNFDPDFKLLLNTTTTDTFNVTIQFKFAGEVKASAVLASHSNAVEASFLAIIDVDGDVRLYAAELSNVTA